MRLHFEMQPHIFYAGEAEKQMQQGSTDMTEENAGFSIMKN